jgi:hypothetical protein
MIHGNDLPWHHVRRNPLTEHFDDLLIIHCGAANKTYDSGR